MLSDGRNRGGFISCVGGIARLRIEKEKKERKKEKKKRGKQGS